MKYSTILILILLPVLAFAGTRLETRELQLSAGEIDTLRIQCGAGRLLLKGIDGLDRIDVTVNIVVEGIESGDLQSFFDQNILLDLGKRGGRAVLRAEFLRSSRFKPREAKMDLLVRVPMKMNINIDDGSGPIIVNDISGNLQVDDGSGSIAIRNITGRVRIGDTSGPISLEDIRGNVNVRDGSGSIDINFVVGNVSVVDASGSITIQDIGGYVKVSDGSGSINIHDISKNVSILQTDSGEISIEGVKGKIIRRDINTPVDESDSADYEE